MPRRTLPTDALETHLPQWLEDRGRTIEERQRVAVPDIVAQSDVDASEQPAAMTAYGGDRADLLADGHEVADRD